MSLVIEWLSGFFLLAGGFLCITGGVGMLRFPDFFSRVHAAGVTDTLATPLLLLGLMLQMDWSLDSLKVLVIMLLVLATNPTASHAMAKAAFHDRLRPLVKGSAKEGGQGETSSKH